MIDPSLGKTLADLGGFALFLLHLVVDAVGLYRQWWVPGWAHEDQDEQIAELQKTVARLTTELRNERRRRRGDPGA